MRWLPSDIGSLVKYAFGNILTHDMNSFESWMRQQGLSETSVKKYSGAVSGPLTAWANESSALSGSLTDIVDISTFQSISTAIQKLPIFIERNSTGHQMYSSALVKFSQYLQRTQDVFENAEMQPGEQRNVGAHVSEQERIALANKLVEAMPGERRTQHHDLKEGGFRILADRKQCAAVYFTNNAPGHVVEFAIDDSHIAVESLEYWAFASWLEHQKDEFGGREANRHKIGKQVNWFRIGFRKYADALLFAQRIVDERRNPIVASRWMMPELTQIDQVHAPLLPTRDTEISAATWESTVRRMVQTALQTSAFSNGQVASQTIKNKNNKFKSDDAFVSYVKSLVEQQKGRCALSGLPLQSDNSEKMHDEMKASLDRIDSNGHYEAGNLQVVCRFINRWKSSDPNSQFKELIQTLREHWLSGS